MEVEENQEGEEVLVFHTYRFPLLAVSSYKYLESMIMTDNDDWVAVICNIGEVWNQLKKCCGYWGRRWKHAGILSYL